MTAEIYYANDKKYNKNMLLTNDKIKNILPQRSAISNKGDYGKLLCICGSDYMPGAAVICAKAAYKSGAGLCSVAVNNFTLSLIAPNLPECTYVSVEEGYNTLLSIIYQYNYVVFGCGIKENEESFDLLKALLKINNLNLILDACAINLLSKDLSLLKSKNANVVITPHPKEFSRLIDMDVCMVNKNRIELAQKFSDEYSVICVLKGAYTVICAPDSTPEISPFATSALAKAGMGDALCGIIGAFACQGARLYDASLYGVFIHAYTAVYYTKKHSEYSLTPLDLCDQLSYTLKQF